MNESIEMFLKDFGAPIDPIFPNEEVRDRYANILPKSLIELWTEKGWAGYADGLFWVTDPSEFSDVLEPWLAGAAMLRKDQYHVIARSAFGDLYVWGTATGLAVIIHPLCSSVTTMEPNKYVLKGNSDLPLGVFFASKTKECFDFEDVKDKGLFKRATKKLGRLKSDEMFAFEPALCLGGPEKLENLTKVKMIEHITLLAQFGEISYTHIDVSRHL